MEILQTKSNFNWTGELLVSLAAARTGFTQCSPKWGRGSIGWLGSGRLRSRLRNCICKGKSIVQLTAISHPACIARPRTSTAATKKGWNVGCPGPLRQSKGNAIHYHRLLLCFSEDWRTTGTRTAAEKKSFGNKLDPSKVFFILNTNQLVNIHRHC